MPLKMYPKEKKNRFMLLNMSSLLLPAKGEWANLQSQSTLHWL